MALPAQAQAAADATGARRSARRRASPATAREPLRGGRTLPPISRLVASDMSAERLDRLLPVIVGATATLIAIAVMGSWPVGAYQDDAMYVVLAKALASGEGYRYLNLPGHPAATHFPPGYPAFLASLWMLAPRFPGNMALFTAANAVFYGLAASGLFHLARVRFVLGRGVALGVTAFGMLVTPVLAALILPFFRKGWMVPTAAR